jgi:hypothetical protein
MKMLTCNQHWKKEMTLDFNLTLIEDFVIPLTLGKEENYFSRFQNHAQKQTFS